MKVIPTIFEDREIRRLYDEKTETWFFKNLKTQNLRDHMNDAGIRKLSTGDSPTKTRGSN